MYFRKFTIVQVVHKQANSCHDPSYNVEFRDFVEAVFNLIYKVVWLMPIIYVTAVAESISGLSFDIVVIGQK